VQHVVHVVVPLRCVPSGPPVLAAHQPVRLVLFVLQHQVDGAVRRRGAHALGQFLQQVLRPVVEDGVHRVQPQPVEVELLYPVEGIVDEVPADRPHARIDGGAQGVSWRSVKNCGAMAWR
jgi:hypothetical protein